MATSLDHLRPIASLVNVNFVVIVELGLSQGLAFIYGKSEQLLPV